MFLVLLGGLAQAELPSLDEPLRTGAVAPSDAAVVIGLEDYAYLADVPYAKRDARAVYDFLVSTRGVPLDRVKLMDSASREQMRAGVEEAAEKAGEDGTVWVYFAGHGVASPSNGKQLLLGDDARQDPAVFESRGMLVEELAKIAGSKGASVALLVDACFNGASRGGDDIVAGTRFAVPVYATKPVPSTLNWAAAEPDQLARPLPEVEHGAFTWLALGALRGWADGEIDGQRDGQVTADEAQLFLLRELPEVGIEDQRPVLSVDNPRSWILSSGATEEKPSLAGIAEAEPVARASKRQGEAEAEPVHFEPPDMPFDPNLLATAKTYGVALPVHKVTFGYKDAVNTRVPGYTYTKLVRSTKRGRSAYTRLYSGTALLLVGSLGTSGGLFGALASGDSRWYAATGTGAAAFATGMGLMVSGQAGIRSATDPLHVIPQEESP